MGCGSTRLVLGLGLGKKHAIISAILDQNASQYGIITHHNNCWPCNHSNKCGQRSVMLGQQGTTMLSMADVLIGQLHPGSHMFLVLMHLVLYSRAVHPNMATFSTENHDIIDTVAWCCIRT